MSALEGLINRQRPTFWQQLWRRPCVTLARWLYSSRTSTPPAPLVDPVTIICISDTHNSQPQLPDGDILIHAGDLTQSGSFRELQATLDWIARQKHATKIVVAGNHDCLLSQSWQGRSITTDADQSRELLDWKDINYLENQEVEVTCENGRRLKVFGSPFSPRNGNWPFQYPRSEDVWANMNIPRDVDILITHGPPRAHLDLNFGCVHLLRALWAIRPRLHVFGHVHEGAGTEWLQYDNLQAAYEHTMAADGGIWILLVTLGNFLTGMLWKRTSVEARSLLVNAAMVGGLRDDMRRKPVTVVI